MREAPTNLRVHLANAIRPCTPQPKPFQEHILLQLFRRLSLSVAPSVLCSQGFGGFLLKRHRPVVHRQGDRQSICDSSAVRLTVINGSRCCVFPSSKTVCGAILILASVVGTTWLMSGDCRGKDSYLQFWVYGLTARTWTSSRHRKIFLCWDRPPQAATR